MFSKEEMEMIAIIRELGIECTDEEALDTYIEICEV